MEVLSPGAYAQLMERGFAQDCPLELLRIYSGEQDLCKFGVTHKTAFIQHLDERDKQITEVYGITEDEFRLKMCTSEKRDLLQARVDKHNKKIPLRHKFTRLLISTVAGAVLNIGLCSVLDVAAFDGASTVGLAAIGAGVGLIGSLFSLCRIPRDCDSILTCPEFERWKLREIKERYDLFANAVINSLGLQVFNRASGIEFLPIIPVEVENSSREGIQATYGQASIERKLDRIWDGIRICGGDPQTVFAREIHRVVGPFKKEDLHYSTRYATETIDSLRSLTAMSNNPVTASVEKEDQETFSNGGQLCAFPEVTRVPDFFNLRKIAALSETT